MPVHLNHHDRRHSLETDLTLFCHQILKQIGNSIFDEKKSQTLNVLKIYKHPDYKKGKNDLALIHIEEDKNISILPVELVRSPLHQHLLLL